MQSNLKKVLVFGPALAQWSEIKTIEESLLFMKSDYQLDFIDPLIDLSKDIHPCDFFVKWRDKINMLISSYDIFFGFSLGGVILQQCFDLFEHNNKLVALFSVPSFCDNMLAERLSRVIQLTNDNLIDAIKELNQYVFYPYTIPHFINHNDPDQGALRLSKGLQFVLETDSRPILQKSHMKYLHLIGQESQLVNVTNVITPPNCLLISIRQAGMRVLINNPDDCVTAITSFLRGA